MLPNQISLPQVVVMAVLYPFWFTYYLSALVITRVIWHNAYVRSLQLSKLFGSFLCRRKKNIKREKQPKLDAFKFAAFLSAGLHNVIHFYVSRIESTGVFPVFVLFAVSVGNQCWIFHLSLFFSCPFIFHYIVSFVCDQQKNANIHGLGIVSAHIGPETVNSRT